jgi:predicted HTH domain antitoxin
VGADDPGAEHLAQRLSPAQRLELSLVGANSFEPIRGKLWLQKEMFLLWKALPKLRNQITYDPALMGPLSEAVDWDLNQLESIGLVLEGPPGVFLSNDGRDVFSAIPKVLDPSALELASRVKTLLNDLSKDELLAFIYFRYPETATESRELANLEPQRTRLAVSLVRKGKLGLEGGAHVAGLSMQDFARLLKSHGVALASE